MLLVMILVVGLAVMEGAGSSIKQITRDGSPDSGNWASAESGIWSSAEPTYSRGNFRLPSEVYPTHYELQLTPHIYGDNMDDFFFEGHVTIHVKCTADTSVVTLHANELNLTNGDISIKQEDGTEELFESSSEENDLYFLHLHLSKSLKPGNNYTIHFSHFTRELYMGGLGLYLSNCNDQGKDVYMATTLMSPTFARDIFPCFDEPQMKATFDVTLVRRTDSANYTTLSNSALVNTTSLKKDGHTWWADKFQRTPVMSTYLLAFVVGELSHLENTTHGNSSITLSTYTCPYALSWAERFQRNALKFFDVLSTMFQPSFSQALPKLDFVAVPDSRALETWGLITFDEADLYRPGVSFDSELSTTPTIVHEIVHTWFGNYVTPKWWDCLWLSEGFAEWWAIYVIEQTLPRWKMVQNWMSKDVFPVMESDALATSEPLNTIVQETPDLGIFTPRTYKKGGLIFRMMQFIMGNDAFVEGLNLYIAQNLYNNTEPSDLFRALDEIMMAQNFEGDYMKTKIDPWVSQMGFPVIIVTRTDNGYRLTQKRFLVGSEDDTDDRYKDAPYDYQWEIPIIYATSEDTRMDKTRDDITWLSKTGELNINFPHGSGSWILININQTVYCRVLYDTDTWHALIDKIKSDNSMFSAINRGQLINDAWALYKADMLNLSIALSTWNILRSEMEQMPWEAFSVEVPFIERMLGRTNFTHRFQRFMETSLQTPLEQLTLNIDEDMVPTDMAVRVVLAKYACKYGLDDCVTLAKQQFAHWKVNGINGINPSFRKIFYCTAVAEGDDTDWDFVYTKYNEPTNSDDESEIDNLKIALTCTQNHNVIRRLLNKTLEMINDGAKYEAVSLWKNVADNHVGLDDLFTFLKENFDHLLERLWPNDLESALIAMTSHFTSHEDLEKLLAIPKMVNISTFQSEFGRAEEQIRDNINWLRDNYEVIDEWLTQ